MEFYFHAIVLYSLVLVFISDRDLKTKKEQKQQHQNQSRNIDTLFLTKTREIIYMIYNVSIGMRPSA